MNLKSVEKNIRRNRSRNKKETRKDIFVKNSKGKFSRVLYVVFEMIKKRLTWSVNKVATWNRSVINQVLRVQVLPLQHQAPGMVLKWPTKTLQIS